MVDRVIIKVCSDGIRGHIVGRMLHRCKGVDILSEGQHYNTSGMLARTSSDTGTAYRDPVDLANTLMHASFLKIIFHIAKGCLIRQGTDGPCTEGLACAEDNLRILMGLGLILTGKV